MDSRTFRGVGRGLKALCSSSTCCLILLHGLIVKVVRNPIVIEQPNAAVHIKDIPFPAFSFCAPQTTIYGFDFFPDLLKNDTVTYPFDLFEEFSMKWNLLDFYMQQRLEYIGFWMLEIRSKSEMVISPYGWCNTFNVVSYDQMFHENSTAEYFQVQQGHVTVDEKKAYKNLTTEPPYFTQSKIFGFNAGVDSQANSIVACYQPYSYLSCGSDIFSWQIKLLVHQPFERPDVKHESFILRTNRLYQLKVTPQIKITDETLLGLDADERRCYKENERKLKFFRTYTSINCLRECESSFMLQKCGCVPYYFINTDRKLICSLAQIDSCFTPEHENFNETTCKCYPPCEELTYDISIQDTEIGYSDLSSFAISGAQLKASFKDDSFYPQIRRKYFTMIDWFSFVGGILGLFFGFSFLSAFEVIFHVWKGLREWKTKRIEKILSVGSSEQCDNGRNRKCGQYLKEFMGNSSIHGFGYISGTEVKFFERLAWAISFILSISACIFMILELRQKLSIDAISISRSDKSFNITQIPFPAVTIINDILSSASFFYVRLFDAYFWKGRRATPEETAFMDLHIVVSSIIFKSHKAAEANAVYRNITNYGPRIVPAIKFFNQTKLSQFDFIFWNQNIPVPFVEILTSKGIGYSFNIAAFDDMFNIEGISEDFTYQNLIYNNGSTTRLATKSPWLSTYSDHPVLSIESQGIKSRFLPHIFLSSPFEYPIQFDPQSGSNFEFKHGKTVEVTIVPEMITTDDDLKKLPLSQRKCYMDGERQLKFFKVYTQRNCEVECLSEKLLESCPCIPFDVVRSNDTRICEAHDYACVDKVRILIELEDSCSCLQSCNLLTYNYEIKEIRHRLRLEDDEDYFAAHEYEDHDSEKENVLIGSVLFKFKDNEFNSMQRSRQFTIFDFLSYIGGLLGLFAGISVLSIFEIFYFFTLRLICEVMRVRSCRGSRVGCGTGAE